VVRLAGEGGEPCGDGIVRAGLDLDVVPGVGVHEVDLGTPEKPIDVLRHGAVPAEEPVGPEDPQIPPPGDRVLGQLPCPRVVDLARAEAGFELGKQIVDVLGREPDRLQASSALRYWRIFARAGSSQVESVTLSATW
jgi:hypothetical protein